MRSIRSSRIHRSSYGSYDSCDPASDYIVPPDDSRNDYILPDSRIAPEPTHVRQFKTRNADAELDEIPHDPSPSARGRSAYALPHEDKSNCGLVKDGGFNRKHDFMRSHGMTSWDVDAYDRTDHIFDGFRRTDAQSARRSSYQQNAEVSPQSSSVFYDSDLPTCVDSDAEEIGYLSGTDLPSFRDDDSLRKYRSMSSDRNPSTSPRARHRRISLASDRAQSQAESPSGLHDTTRPYREPSPSAYGIGNEYCARERNPSTSRIRRGSSRSSVPYAMSHCYYRRSSRSPRSERHSSRAASLYAGSDVEAGRSRSDTAGSGSNYMYASDGADHVGLYVTSDVGGRSIVYNESDDEYGDDCVEDGWSSDECGGYDE
ncbi:hypothetical protein BDU57DRAFT_69394 [Ampelomyces quisqualis]|uniref:Uncharacterized protein n=1 Tax=Ampelomyces quisqualis TaxID=50730 RepID=A0A6A5R5K2_AMPQU|nr:hypothetical protein BDU57DRAFT_69394 [Ampelomyces quisqualis]